MVTIIELQMALAPATLIALSDDDGDGVADTGVLNDALAKAEVDVRHRVSPQTIGEDLPHVLADAVVTLAIERLYERRRETPPSPWVSRAERARLILADIASGKLPLNTSATPALLKRAPTLEDRQATAQTLKGY